MGDTVFYDLLGVPKDASTGQIKKAYYKLAREWHPDKNPDDPKAEDKFKELTQAYEILSDPEKREKYDKYGKDSVLNNRGDGPDNRAMFKVLFGADLFEDCFGELSFGMHMDQELAGVYDPYQRELAVKVMEIERQEELVAKLLNKIEYYITDKDKKHKKFRELIEADIEEKLQVPGGASLLAAVGYVYKQEAIKFSGGFLGIGGFLEGAKEFGHMFKSVFGMVYAAAEMENEINRLQMEHAKNLEGMDGDEARKAEQELERKILEKGMTGIWKMGMLEIEAIVRGVAQRVLTDLDKEVPKDVMKKRGEALKMMGEMYKEAGQKGKKFEQHPVSHLDDLEKKAAGKDKEENEKEKEGETEKEKEKEDEPKEKEKENDAPAPGTGGGIDGLD